MNDTIRFQIVCVNCGCLSIKIAEPLTSPREAIVYCGDCGNSRGTVGALRDLSVQRCSSIAFPELSALLSADAADEAQPSGRISRQYAELQRLRRQVKVAECLANESARPFSTHARKIDARHSAFRPSSLKPTGYVGDQRDQKQQN
jgi:hypothetical protein